MNLPQTAFGTCPVSKPHLYSLGEIGFVTICHIPRVPKPTRKKGFRHTFGTFPKSSPISHQSRLPMLWRIKGGGRVSKYAFLAVLSLPLIKAIFH